VLVGRGFGTKVLDDFFLKVTEQVSTSPMEAGAFVKNVRGVTLYGDSNSKPKSYEFEKFFGGKMELLDSEQGHKHDGIITQGSMLINPEIYGKSLTRNVRIYSTYTNSESSNICDIVVSIDHSIYVVLPVANFDELELCIGGGNGSMQMD